MPLAQGRDRCRSSWKEKKEEKKNKNKKPRYSINTVTKL